MKLAVAILSFILPEFVLKHALFQQVAFLPSLVYNLLCVWLTKRKWYSRVDDWVVLGGLPFEPLVDQLLQTERVSAVVSLNQNFELAWCAHGERWRARGVRFLQLPTGDIFDAPDVRKLRCGVQFIFDHVRQRGPSVYVHCKAGRTRSATLVACYLMQRHGYGPDECIKAIRTARSHVLLEEAQLGALKDYHRQFVQSPCE